MSELLSFVFGPRRLACRRRSFFGVALSSYSIALINSFRRPRIICSRRMQSFIGGSHDSVFVSFGALKPATHRRPKPATMWVVLGGRIVLFGPVGKGRDQVVAV